MTGRDYGAGQIKGEADPGVISEDEDEFAVSEHTLNNDQF